jgi:DNA-directed RNA polymerase subunit omega
MYLVAKVSGRTSMLDIDLEERLVEKVGGKFKVTKLIQQRLLELNRGARPLVEVEDAEPVPQIGPPSRQELLRIIIREILEDKIELAPKSEIELSIEEEAAARLKEGKPAEEQLFGEELKKIKEERVKELTGFLQAKE